MNKITIEEIIRATEGTLIRGQNENFITGVKHDSRECGEGDMFVAIKGENQDGHKYIPQVMGKGCRTVLVSHTDGWYDEVSDIMSKEEINIIKVENTVYALGQLASYYLATLGVLKIAVTGSVGKTSVRDMIYYALSEKYVCGRNLKNYNNFIGLPISIFQFDDETEAVVLEMGMDKFSWLSLSADRFLFLFLLFLFVDVQNCLNRLLCDQQFFFFFSYLAVLSIVLFLLDCQTVKLLIQRLHGWELRDLRFIKGLLCRFMNCDLLTMFLKELFAISRLAILYIDLPCITVVLDMLLQSLNFHNSFLCGLDGIRKLIKTSRQFFNMSSQIIVVTQTFFFQKDDGTGSFFSVELLCPLLVTDRFAFSHFCLNINKHLELLLCGSLCRTTSGSVQALTGDNRLQFLFAVSFAQRAQT
ncbi:MAG: hypothetical protein IKJ85_00280, partial [Firmicutes bacterium]|nr:hypothetical protein [Bacillota bacterium]